MSLFSFLSNPATFAVFTVVAIGVIIYEIVNHQNEGGHHHGGGGGRGSGPKGPGPSSSSPSGDSKSSSFTSYKDLKKDVRNRKPSSQETKIQPLPQTKVKSKEELSDRSKKTPRSSKFDEEEYSKDVYDKIESDVKNFNKAGDDKKTFHKDIVSDCSESTSLNKDEIKFINTGAKGEHIQGNNPSTSGSRGNVYNQETVPEDFSSPRLTDESPANDTNSDNSLCMSCADVFANAEAYPCKHCYLCMNCATIVHRIYTKCTICLSEIEYFRELET